MTYAHSATPPFYHGTRADLVVGDMIRVGITRRHRNLYINAAKFEF